MIRGRTAGCLYSSSMLDGAETYQAVGFVEREMPRISAGKAAACAGRMRLECARTEQDSHSFVAERLDAPAERVTASQCRVDEREHHDRGIEAGNLRQHAESIGVADAMRPLIDRVVSRRSHHDGVRYLRPGRARLAVLA